MALDYLVRLHSLISVSVYPPGLQKHVCSYTDSSKNFYGTESLSLCKVHQITEQRARDQQRKDTHRRWRAGESTYRAWLPFFQRNGKRRVKRWGARRERGKTQISMGVTMSQHTHQITVKHYSAKRLIWCVLLCIIHQLWYSFLISLLYKGFTGWS